MAWCSKWINGDDFPDGVEVTLNRDGNMRRYLPERTCEVVNAHFDELDEYPHTWLSCGHHTMLLPNEMQYCPQCGARVLEPSSNLLGQEER